MPPETSEYRQRLAPPSVNIAHSDLEPVSAEIARTEPSQKAALKLDESSSKKEARGLSASIVTSSGFVQTTALDGDTSKEKKKESGTRLPHSKKIAKC